MTLKPELDENSPEDRERGDCQRNCNEQTIGDAIDVGREPLGAGQPDSEPKPERHQQRRRRYRACRATVSALLQMTELEARANLEHQQRQPDLAQHGNRFGGFGPEQPERQIGRDRAEQRRTEHQPGDDFTHRPGLSKAARN